MAKVKLCPKTLRWVSRKLRAQSKNRKLAPILADSDASWANVFLNVARTIERQSKGKP